MSLDRESLASKIINGTKSIIIENNDYFYGEVKVRVELTEREREEILDEFPVPLMPNKQTLPSFDTYEDGQFTKNIMVLVDLDETEIKIASNGKPYLDAKFSNSAGSFKGKIWDDNGSAAEAYEFFKNNKVAYVSGKVEQFPKPSADNPQGGPKNLKITIYSKPEIEVDPFDLLPQTNENIEHLILELIHYLKQIEQPHQSIAMGGLKALWKDFSTKPGAKRHHHAYLAGLLKHTLGLMRIGRYLTKTKSPVQAMFMLLETVRKQHRLDMIQQLTSESPLRYNKLVWSDCIDHLHAVVYNFAASFKKHGFDPNQFLASITLHDFGKPFDYTHVGDGNKYVYLFPHATDIGDYHELYNASAGGIGMDELGSLVGHMPYGVLLFNQVIKEIGVSISLKTIHEYMHCILSHHGKNEWGSSVVPQLPSAFALHFVDYLDSRFEVSTIHA